MTDKIEECLAAVEAFKTGFEQAFMPAHPTMAGYGVAVFDDRIKAVSVTQTLRGGPNFVRIPIDPDISSHWIVQAIAEGGDQELATIMLMMRRTNNAVVLLKSDVDRIRTAARDFVQRVDVLQDGWRLRVMM